MTLPRGSTAPTLSCREVNAALGDYVDDRLAPDARASFEAHLGWCVRCLGYLRGYRETVRIVRASRAVTRRAMLPETLVRAIVERRRLPR